MDLCIKASGEWIHEGRPIKRLPLVRLFASILRREDDGHYYLVTPQEKWRIAVDDLPFRIIDVEADTEGVRVVSDMGEQFLLDEEHPLILSPRADRSEGEKLPAVLVRYGNYARVSRAAWYRLVELAQLEPCADGGSTDELVVYSRGQRFSLGFC